MVALSFLRCLFENSLDEPNCHVFLKPYACSFLGNQSLFNIFNRASKAGNCRIFLCFLKEKELRRIEKFRLHIYGIKVSDLKDRSNGI